MHPRRDIKCAPDIFGELLPVGKKSYFVVRCGKVSRTAGMTIEWHELSIAKVIYSGMIIFSPAQRGTGRRRKSMRFGKIQRVAADSTRNQEGTL